MKVGTTEIHSRESVRAESDESKGVSSAYSPSGVYKVCHYQRKAMILTSWTEKNPGRRFFCCKNWKDEALNCNYFEWLDPEVSKHMKDALRILMKEKDSLKKEREAIDVELNMLREKNSILQLKLATWEEKFNALTWRNDEMEKENSRLRDEVIIAKAAGKDNSLLKLMFGVMVLCIMLAYLSIRGRINVTHSMLP